MDKLNHNYWMMSQSFGSRTLQEIAVPNVLVKNTLVVGYYAEEHKGFQYGVCFIRVFAVIL